MVDPFIAHELIYDWEFPEELQSDVSRITDFARKNNVSLKDLREALLLLKNKLDKEEKTSENWKTTIMVLTR